MALEPGTGSPIWRYEGTGQIYESWVIDQPLYVQFIEKSLKPKNFVAAVGRHWTGVMAH